MATMPKIDRWRGHVIVKNERGQWVYNKSGYVVRTLWKFQAPAPTRVVRTILITVDPLHSKSFPKNRERQ